MNRLFTILLALTITASAQTITLHVTQVHHETPQTTIIAHTQHVVYVLVCAETAGDCQSSIGITSATRSAHFITVRAADGGFDVYRIVTEKEINKSVAR